MTTYIILQNEIDDNKIIFINQNDDVLFNPVGSKPILINRIQHLEQNGWFDTDISFTTTQDVFMLYLTIQQDRTITGAYLCKDEANKASAQSFSDSIEDWRNEPSIIEEYQIELDSGNDEKNPSTIVHKMKDYMFCKFDMKSEEMVDAINVFKGDIPENYYEDGTWTLSFESVPNQVFNLMLFFINLPEYQLK